MATRILLLLLIAVGLLGAIWDYHTNGVVSLELIRQGAVDVPTAIVMTARMIIYVVLIAIGAIGLWRVRKNK